MIAPVIETARLRLRPHVMEDMDVFWAFYQSPRAEFMDCPKTKTHLFYGLSSEVGSWALMGHGGWAIETKEGRLAGQVAITQPPHFPERELGWLLFDGFEGQGIAQEAALAALFWAWDTLGADTLVSYVHKRNARSVALAQRLGAVQDDTAAVFDAADIVYRHSPDADGSVEAYA